MFTLWPPKPKGSCFNCVPGATFRGRRRHSHSTVSSSLLSRPPTALLWRFSTNRFRHCFLFPCGHQCGQRTHLPLPSAVVSATGCCRWPGGSVPATGVAFGGPIPSMCGKLRTAPFPCFLTLYDQLFRSYVSTTLPYVTLVQPSTKLSVSLWPFLFFSPLRLFPVRDRSVPRSVPRHSLRIGLP